MSNFGTRISLNTSMPCMVSPGSILLSASTSLPRFVSEGRPTSVMEDTMTEQGEDNELSDEMRTDNFM